MPDIRDILRSHADQPRSEVDIEALSRRATQRTRVRRALMLGGATVVSVAVLALSSALSSNETQRAVTADGVTVPDPMSGSSAPPDSSSPSCDVPVAEPGAGEQIIDVSFYCGGSGGFAGDPLISVPRVVNDTSDPLTAALQALVDGPTETELESGFRSGVLADAVIGPVSASIENSVALIEIPLDTTRWNNFSTSNVTTYFIRAVLSTTFHIPAVESVDMSKLCTGTEIGCDQLIGRSEWQTAIGIEG